MLKYRYILPVHVAGYFASVKATSNWSNQVAMTELGDA